MTPTEVQQALAAIAASIKQSGSNATLTEVAVANGLPPDMLGELGRYQAIETKLLDRLDGGKLPSAYRGAAGPGGRVQQVAVPGGQEPGHPDQPAVRRARLQHFSVVAAPSTLSATQTSKSAAKVTRNPPC